MVGIGPATFVQCLPLLRNIVEEHSQAVKGFGRHPGICKTTGDAVAKALLGPLGKSVEYGRIVVSYQIVVPQAG